MIKSENWLDDLDEILDYLQIDKTENMQYNTRVYRELMEQKREIGCTKHLHTRLKRPRHFVRTTVALERGVHPYGLPNINSDIRNSILFFFTHEHIYR